MEALRKKVGNFIDNDRTQLAIVILILLNALFMGLETFQSWRESMGILAIILDQIFVWIFLLEVLLKIFAHRFSFFCSGWNIFDLVIVL